MIIMRLKWKMWKRAITDKTKVISIAHVSNVVGDVRPIKDIIKLAHSNGNFSAC